MNTGKHAVRYPRNAASVNRTYVLCQPQGAAPGGRRPRAERAPSRRAAGEPGANRGSNIPRLWAMGRRHLVCGNTLSPARGWGRRKKRAAFVSAPDNAPPRHREAKPQPKGVTAKKHRTNHGIHGTHGRGSAGRLAVLFRVVPACRGLPSPLPLSCAAPAGPLEVSLPGGVSVVCQPNRAPRISQMHAAGRG